MRLLQVVHQYPPSFVGGTELYTQFLAHGLVTRGNEVAVFHRESAVGTGLHQHRSDGLSLWAAWDGELRAARRFTASLYAPALLDSFRRALDANHPTLVHIQHLMGLPLAVVDELQARGIPYIVSLHDFWWVCANAQLITNYSQELCGGPRAYLNCARCALARIGCSYAWPLLPGLMALLAWRAARLRAGLRQAVRLIAPSEFVRQWYIAHGAESEHIVVIPHGIHLPAGAAAEEQQRERDALRCLYLGGISWQKGVHVVVEALRGARDVELWIAGNERSDPAYAAHLHAIAGDNIRFLGQLSRAEVWRTLSQVDVLLVPSLWYETFSLVVREAFAVGLPVLVSDLGALAEVAGNHGGGLCVPAGDVVAWRKAVQRLADEPARLMALRTRVSPPLTLEAHLDTVETLYDVSVG